MNMEKKELDSITFSIELDQEQTFMVGVKDILSAPVDAIVNPANSGLSHGGGLAAVISEQAGPELDEACDRVIEKIGRIPVTMAAPTGAFNLPYKGIIHAVGPRMGDGNELAGIEKTIHNCLLVAEKRGWQSVAFPAISTGIFGVPKEVCAEAFKNAIPLFFDMRPASMIDPVWLCLTKDDFPVFKLEWLK